MYEVAGAASNSRGEQEWHEVSRLDRCRASASPRTPPLQAGRGRARPACSALLLAGGRKAGQRSGTAVGQHHRWAPPGNLSARSIQLGTAVAPSLPHRLQRMRGPKDGTVASSAQSSILTARSWPQCWQVACSPRTPCRRIVPSVMGRIGSSSLIIRPAKNAQRTKSRTVNQGPCSGRETAPPGLRRRMRLYLESTRRPAIPLTPQRSGAAFSSNMCSKPPTRSRRITSLLLLTEQRGARVVGKTVSNRARRFVTIETRRRSLHRCKASDDGADGPACSISRKGRARMCPAGGILHKGAGRSCHG